MELRLLSLGPRLRIGNERLVAETPWRLRLLTFGLIVRRVVVDVRQSEVVVERRLWLFARRRRIRFAWIKAVTYGYENWSFSSWFSSVHDGLDHFTVGLRLHDGDDVALFTYFGEGTVVNDGPWPDRWYRDRLAADLSGSQEADSRGFVDGLSRLIGVPVIPP